MHFKKLESYLRLNLLGPGPRLIKKNLPGRGLAKVEKHWRKALYNAVSLLEERSVAWDERRLQAEISQFLPVKEGFPRDVLGSNPRSVGTVRTGVPVC
jgi:hypothetical protein